MKKRPAKDPSERAFSWYPGHMVKAKRELEANLKLADAVLLMLDARAPVSTRHLDLERLLGDRQVPFVFILNKTYLAEEKESKLWADFLRQQGHLVAQMNSLQGRGQGALTPLLSGVANQVNARREKKGLLPREPRLMVAGLPNSGKSTLLNRLVGQTRFKAGKKPGLTRGAQWVRVFGQYQLLDTPGILYPRIEGDLALAVLAVVGSVKRDVLPQEKVCQTLLNLLFERQRLADFLPQVDLGQENWQKAPLQSLTSLWDYQNKGDNEPTRRAFERFLNLLATAKQPITWERCQAR